MGCAGSTTQASPKAQEDDSSDGKWTKVCVDRPGSDAGEPPTVSYSTHTAATAKPSPEAKDDGDGTSTSTRDGGPDRMRHAEPLTEEKAEAVTKESPPRSANDNPLLPPSETSGQQPRRKESIDSNSAGVNGLHLPPPHTDEPLQQGAPVAASSQEIKELPSFTMNEGGGATTGSTTPHRKNVLLAVGAAAATGVPTLTGETPTHSALKKKHSQRGHVMFARPSPLQLGSPHPVHKKRTFVVGGGEHSSREVALAELLTPPISSIVAAFAATGTTSPESENGTVLKAPRQKEEEREDAEEETPEVLTSRAAAEARLLRDPCTHRSYTMDEWKQRSWAMRCPSSKLDLCFPSNENFLQRKTWKKIARWIDGSQPSTAPPSQQQQQQQQDDFNSSMGRSKSDTGSFAEAALAYQGKPAERSSGGGSGGGRQQKAQNHQQHHRVTPGEQRSESPEVHRSTSISMRALGHMSLDRSALLGE